MSDAVLIAAIGAVVTIFGSILTALTVLNGKKIDKSIAEMLAVKQLSEANTKEVAEVKQLSQDNTKQVAEVKHLTRKTALQVKQMSTGVFQIGYLEQLVDDRIKHSNLGSLN